MPTQGGVNPHRWVPERPGCLGRSSKVEREGGFAYVAGGRTRGSRAATSIQPWQCRTRPAGGRRPFRRTSNPAETPVEALSQLQGTSAAQIRDKKSPASWPGRPARHRPLVMLAKLVVIPQLGQGMPKTARIVQGASRASGGFRNRAGPAPTDRRERSPQPTPDSLRPTGREPTGRQGIHPAPDCKSWEGIRRRGSLDTHFADPPQGEFSPNEHRLTRTHAASLPRFEVRFSRLSSSLFLVS